MRTTLSITAAVFVFANAAHRIRLCAGLLIPHCSSNATLLVSLSPLLLVSPSPAHADIFQWEYINPADPSQGKRQSTTLARDGAGVDAVPGANLYGRNLTIAYLIGADLADSNAFQANLANADLSKANLTNAYFAGATLTDAEFTGAEVRGASFFRDSYYGGTGMTLAQLHSTASYQARDLTGIDLGYNDLSGGNFTRQNLTNAYFFGATLTGAEFSGAGVRGADFYNSGITLAQLYSTASYQAHDLSGIVLGYNDLSGGNFAGQNLTDADFRYATLTGADFSGTEVRGAIFINDNGTGITLAQLYSTASYQAHDLTGITVYDSDLSGANFAGQNLTNASFAGANLTGANFREANLTNASFGRTLTDADFTGAQVRGAGFSGITLAQLYSTASYQAHDLTGIRLSGDLSGGNFAAQNLTNASFAGAIASFAGANLTSANFREANLTSARIGGTLTDADFTGANVCGVNFDAGYHNIFYDNGGRWISSGTGISPAQLYSTASYQAHDLNSISLRGNDLSGANFAGQNLTNASLYAATLTGADFTNAEVRGTSFDRFAYYFCDLGCDPVPTGTGISLEQLYSTASYQAHDLSGISLHLNDLAGGNFSGQNLTNAHLTAYLTNADFTAADARGGYLDPAEAITANLVWPDGHIDGLDLDAGGLLVVRDYDGNSNSFSPTDPIPITVVQHVMMSPGGTLRMVFETDAWDSTISFAPGIPVTLGGTLELTFANDVNLATQLGRTFHLFDWTGVNPTGAFTVSSSYDWNLSNLYTTGEITLTAVPEPSVLLLICIGIAGLLPMRRVVPRRPSRVPRIIAAMFPIVAFAASARADIFQWEYIDPADPSQGKRQSTTLAPDGAGVDAAPDAHLGSRNLAMAYLVGADLTNASGNLANLTYADLSRSMLTNAEFFGVTLTDADFSNAAVGGARFDRGIVDGSPGGAAGPVPYTRWPAERPDENSLIGSGITLAQLYSTTSFQANDLSNLSLGYNLLDGAHFAGKDFTNASFFFATLSEVDFRRANLSNTNLNYAVLTRADLRDANLSNASFSWATLTNANFADQTLTNADFSYTDVTSTDFSHANLFNADFSGASLTDAILIAADARGASFGIVQPCRYVCGPIGTGLARAVTTNLIFPNGQINGLDLDADSQLVVRDYDGNPNFGNPLPPIPITVDQHLTMGAGGALRMVFEADAWDSTISFAPGIPVTLGGTLELTFAADVNPASQVGRTFDLFDWTGVNPTGAFAISSPYVWNMSNLYTTGEVTLSAIPEPKATVLLSIPLIGAVFLIPRRLIDDQ